MKMAEPVKPFACSMPDCGMTFTNEDHLHVHMKKHDMVLQFGMEQKAAFVADQTPTPTRFIRNCEEVGLFLDLPNDNPFEEGFKRAMETAKHGLSSMEHPSQSTEDLHTPQMVFPAIDQADSALFTSNNQRNITISRSSSDESGAIKEYETTTISKLTNQVTTISRRVEKHDTDKHTDETTKQIDKDISETIYTNNVIKIRKDNLVNVECSISGHNNIITYTDSVTKDVNIPVPPIMSQKSIDNVVESLTSDLCNDDTKLMKSKNETDEYMVTITLPGGKKINMKSVDEKPKSDGEKPKSVDEKPKSVDRNVKEKLKSVITSKAQTLPVIQSIGTLIPVTILPALNKMPIMPLTSNVIGNVIEERKTVKRRVCKSDVGGESSATVVKKDRNKVTREHLNSRVAASRRYRVRLKETMNQQVAEIARLREANKQLAAELAAVKSEFMEHVRTCSAAGVGTTLAGMWIPQEKTKDIPDNT